MGLVYLALDPQGRAVALKMLRGHIAADREARLRMSREVDSLRRVQHPRIAEVLDADISGDVPYLVTRFVPGKPLDGHVREYGPLSDEHLARVGAALGDALGALHRAGIVHRDVKPANVMMLDGDPVLIDFGIAHLADQSRITMTGLVMGTPGYLSPEVTDGAAVSPETDWWGWGATLAFAATGRPPFGTGPIEVVLDRVRRGAADLDGINGPARASIAAALSTDPRARWSGQQLITGLTTAARTITLPDEAGSLVKANARGGNPYAAPRTVAYGPPPAKPPAGMSAAPPPAPTVPAKRPAPTVPNQAPVPQAAPEPPAAPGGEGARGPRDQRNSTLLVLLATLAACAAVVPAVTVLVTAVGLVLARVVDASVTALWRRRYTHGPRPGDVPYAVFGLPWRLVTSTMTTLLALILPLVLGVSVAFLTGLAAAGDAGTPQPGGPWALALGMVALVMAAWWGPGGGQVRRGTRTLVRGATRTPVSATVLIGFLVLLLISAVLVAYGGTTDWWPVPALGDAVVRRT